MTQKWITKYERKPGRWVFEPTDEHRVIGSTIKDALFSVWDAPNYYFHLRHGGHVAALKLHATNTYFIRFDIEDFFGRVNRSRVTRCLKDYFGYDNARDMANDSTVQHPTEKGRWVLPYGFVQSPILASLALSRSRLGGELDRLNRSTATRVSVYVDDIIISCNNIEQLGLTGALLAELAVKSGLSFGSSKTQGPGAQITAFNIELTHENLAIASDRLDQFGAVLADSPSEHRREGILGYVKTVNALQAANLAKI